MYSWHPCMLRRWDHRVKDQLTAYPAVYIFTLSSFTAIQSETSSHPIYFPTNSFLSGISWTHVIEISHSTIIGIQLGSRSCLTFDTWFGKLLLSEICQTTQRNRPGIRWCVDMTHDVWNMYRLPLFFRFMSSDGSRHTTGKVRSYTMLWEVEQWLRPGNISKNTNAPWCTSNHI